MAIEIKIVEAAEFDASKYARKAAKRGSQYGDVLEKLEVGQVATFDGLTTGQVSYMRQMVNGLGGKTPRPPIKPNLEMLVKRGSEKDLHDVAVRIKPAAKTAKK